MLRLLGSQRKLCDGISRRDLLQVGGASMAGLGLSSLLARQAAAEGNTSSLPGFGKAKQCIVLFLYGSPSQMETFDMKPQAPVEVRGTMQPISSSLPGLDVCEHLPQMAKVMDKVSVVRSVTHPHPIHGVAYAMTGTSLIDVAMELNPRDDRHHPYFGSCVAYADEQLAGPNRGALQNIALPFPFSSKRSDQPFRAGPYGAYLGAGYDPIWTEFEGTGTTVLRKERDNGNFWFEGPEPYLGCTNDSHFRLASVEGHADLKTTRLNRRRDLLTQFDELRRDLDSSTASGTLSKFQEMAWDVIASPKIGEALDIRHEPASLRDRYGRGLFGESCLAARRLVEAGSRIVSVFWDEYGLAGDAWDTHFDHFRRMTDQLCPGLDPAVYGLLTDLDDRGMLDETLVVLISEHGRTPKINNAVGGGRDHWSRAYSVMLAGGGIKRGSVLGATDDIAGDVTERPVDPKSILATMYHLLGIDPWLTIPDRSGRPISLVPHEAEVVRELLA